MPIGVIFVIALAALAIGAATVTTTLINMRRTLKRSGPRCGYCSYDLTGSDANRCPECGKLFIEAGVVLPLGPHAVQRFRRTVIRAAVVFSVVLVLLVSMGLLTAHMVVQAQRAAAAQARAAAVQSQAAAAALLQRQRQQLAASRPASEESPDR